MSFRLPVKLTPGASVDRIDGWALDAGKRPVLKVRVRARPIEGEANAALIQVLAKTLGLPRSALSLARGGQSRLTLIDIATLDEIAVRARLSEP